MTGMGGYAPLAEHLPADLASLVRIVQGLLLHQHWAGAYGEALTEARLQEPHLRGTEPMLHRIFQLDDRPLAASRPLATRLVAVCRHFSVLLAAMLRAKGVSARARCGFATYFERGLFIDHWVCEHWDARSGRWVLIDAQLDELQRDRLQLDFDPLDVPRDRFVIAGDAWADCRAGRADPARFGILDLFGWWFVAGNVLRDAAALNNMEMLPWDFWGAMPRPDEPIDAGGRELLDRLARLAQAPDAGFAELRRTYEDDDRVRVPAEVFNALHRRLETVGW